MGERPAKTQIFRTFEDIRQVLLRDWDPIGVKDSPEAQDEYDSYVWPVYSILLKRGGPRDVAAYLAELVQESMGLGTSQDREEIVADYMAIAKKICAIDVKGGNHAL